MKYKAYLYLEMYSLPQVLYIREVQYLSQDRQDSTELYQAPNLLPLEFEANCS